jgi:hypothetical protein
MIQESAYPVRQGRLTAYLNSLYKAPVLQTLGPSGDPRHGKFVLTDRWRNL